MVGKPVWTPEALEIAKTIVSLLGGDPKAGHQVEVVAQRLQKFRDSGVEAERLASSKMVRDFANFWGSQGKERHMLETIANAPEKPWVPLISVKELQSVPVKLYKVGEEVDVDAALQQVGRIITDNDGLSWWQVAELLFEAGYEMEARLAHMRAVPSLV